jgi:protein TonB
MQTVYSSPLEINHDRLGVSLVASIAMHMVLVLMVAFIVPQIHKANGLPNLEITLVQTSTDKAPKEADFLAQVNQDGGGNSDRPDIARNPLPVRELGDKRTPMLQSMPQKATQSKRETLDILAMRSDTKARGKEATPDKKEARETPLQLGLMTPEELREESARLNAEIDRTWAEEQKRPKRKYLNARTQEYKYAAYMEAWRARVERIGSANYAEEAKRRALRGTLIVDVLIGANGEVKEIRIPRSSGQQLVDDAAKRILELASPFAPLPPEIRAEADEIWISRTWLFNESLFSMK